MKNAVIVWSYKTDVKPAGGACEEDRIERLMGACDT